MNPTISNRITKQYVCGSLFRVHGLKFTNSGGMRRFSALSFCVRLVRLSTMLITLKAHFFVKTVLL